LIDPQFSVSIMPCWRTFNADFSKMRLTGEQQKLTGRFLAPPQRRIRPPSPSLPWPPWHAARICAMYSNRLFESRGTQIEMIVVQLSEKFRYVLLDGGLATTLELKGADLKNHLWSASLLINDPKGCEFRFCSPKEPILLLFIYSCNILISIHNK
jgi:hypothetical protein